MGVIDDLKFQYRTGNIVTRLIFLNILFFAVPEILFAVLQLFQVNIGYLNFVSLSTDFTDLLWKPWSLISYAFFHFGFIHLIFNMLMLYFVGILFLTYFTQKQFLALYVYGAIFSGLIYLLGYHFLPALTNVTTSMVGASGAIMAVLLAIVGYQPQMQIRLLLIGSVKMWQIAAVLVIIDLIQLPMNNTGGHIAHLSGALFGYVFIKLLMIGTDISVGFNFIIDGITRLFSRKKTTPFRKVHVNPKKQPQKRESKIVTKDKTQQQIDEILDKISQSGYDSLTKEEKEFLFKSGQ